MCRKIKIYAVFDEKEKHMKKIITGAVLLTMLVLCTSLSVGAVVYGDANRDGNVDITDLIAIKKYCSGYSVNIDTSAVDADQNDIIDSSDMAKLKSVILGISKYEIITDGYDYLNVTALDKEEAK